MSHALTHGTLITCTPSSLSCPTLASRRLITSLTHCEDPLPLQECGSYPELPPPTGYEPNRIVDNQINDDHYNVQFTEIEDRVKSLSYSWSFLSSTQDSAESMATPPESDFDDEQIRALLGSPRYLPERESSAQRSPVNHSERESLMSSSSQDPTSTRKPVAVFSSQNRLNQDTFSVREQPADIVGSHESIFRFSNPANVAKPLRHGNRDHLLTPARSELMKQEHEFSKNELRDSHATIQELTSQVQELQERMNNMNDSREFQDRVDLQWNIISRWNSSLFESKCYRWKTPCRRVQETCCEK